MSGNKEKTPASTQALHIEDDLDNAGAAAPAFLTSNPSLDKNNSSYEYLKQKRNTYRSFNHGDNCNGVQQWKRFWIIKAKDEKTN